MKRIAFSVSLIGLMGAGKTAIGNALAEKLAFPFIDTDSVIAQKTGLSISQIFTLHGEETFRQFEQQYILPLLESSPVRILSLGGGAVNNDAIRSALLEKTFVIWLNPSLKTLVNRLERSPTPRPLLVNQNPRHVLSRLLRERTPFYSQAHMTINTDALSIQETVGRILDRL